MWSHFVIVLLCLVVLLEETSAFSLHARGISLTNNRRVLKPLRCQQQIFESQWSSSVEDSSIQNKNIIEDTLPTTNKVFIMNALSSMVAFFIGDIIGQISTSLRWNIWRTLRMAAFGLLIQGPLATRFHYALQRSVPEKDKSSLLKKIFAEQLLWAPTYAAALIVFLGVLRGDSPRSIAASMGFKMTRLVRSSWTLWIPTHLLCYFFIPSRYLPLVLNAAQIAMNSVHSVMAN
eukprot:scaffold2913_cov181-Ochromonas_danica.AAC.33